MVTASGVEVLVARHSDAAPYPEHTVPNTHKYPVGPNERYIEAVTDERFVIQVKLLPEFEFMGHPQVRVQYFTTDSTKYAGQRLPTAKPASSTAGDRSHYKTTLSNEPAFIGGQWMTCGLVFGELKADEDITMNLKEVAQQVENTERILIKLTRGQVRRKKLPERENGLVAEASNPPEDLNLDTSSEEVVHKHNVTHAIKHVPIEPVAEAAQTSAGYKRWFSPAEGPAGEAIVFTICSRSRAALVALGILEEDTSSVFQNEAHEAPTSGRLSPEANTTNETSFISEVLSSTLIQEPGAETEAGSSRRLSDGASGTHGRDRGNRTGESEVEPVGPCQQRLWSEIRADEAELEAQEATLRARGEVLRLRRARLAEVKRPNGFSEE